MIRHFVALFAGALWVALASQVHAESLREVVAQAVATHPSIEASRASGNAAIWDMKAAQSRLLPALDGRANIGPFIIDQPEGFAPDVNNEWRLQRQLSLTVSQILFDGGDRSNDIRRTAALADATSYRSLEQSENVALDAIEAYIDVRRLAAILELARQNRKKLSSILELVKDLTSGGSAPTSATGNALRPGIPALSHFPLAAWRRACDQAIRRAGPSALGYGDPVGEPALRTAIARHLAVARGVRCALMLLVGHCARASA